MWKDVPGWEQLYEVNENGDVRNVVTNQLIVRDRNSIGYCRVTLYNKNHFPSKQRFFRHRLVAQVFIENPSDLPEVNHIDHDKTNNHVSNLEWVTRTQNEHDSHIFGSKPYKPYRVTLNNGTIHDYNFLNELANILHVTRQTVRFWLIRLNEGYKNYGIERIEYI